MFTLKRFALLGAAGLAAFSISCSDDGGGDDPPSAGGGTITDLVASDAVDGIISVTGTATANEGSTVASAGVDVKVGGSTNGVTDNSTIQSSTATIVAAINVNNSKACEGKSGQSVSVKIDVTVSFSPEGSATQSVTKTATCEAAVVNEIPVLNLEVGGSSPTLGSFVDLDGKVAYTSGQFVANAAKIDIIYAGGLSAVDAADRDRIWSASDFGLEYEGNYAVLEDNLTAIAPLSAFVDAATVTAAYTALTASTSIPETAVSPWLGLIQEIGPGGTLENTWDEASDNGYIELVTDKVFIAFSTEGKYFVVAVNTTGARTSVSIAYLNPTLPQP